MSNQSKRAGNEFRPCRRNPALGFDVRLSKHLFDARKRVLIQTNLEASKVVRIASTKEVALGIPEFLGITAESAEPVVNNITRVVPLVRKALYHRLHNVQIALEMLKFSLGVKLGLP